MPVQSVATDEHRLDAALTAYQQAAQQAGQQRQVTLAATINHAQTLLALGRYPQAEAAFGALLKQIPENPAIRLGVALAALGRGDERSAITRLSALRDDPLVGRQARHYLGLALLASGSEQGQPDPQSLPIIRDALIAHGIRVLNGQQSAGQADADADLVIKLSGRIQNQTEMAGVGMHGAVVELQADAYWQQEQRLLVSEHSIANAAAGNASAALSRAYQQAARQLAPRLIERLSDAWRQEAYNSRLISVTASGSHPQTRQFLSRLSRVFGVRKASLKRYHDGRAQLSVRFTGSAALLAELIAHSRFDPLNAEITDIDQNRLGIKLSPL